MADWRQGEGGGAGAGDAALLSPRAVALLARIDADLPALAAELIPRSPSASAGFLAAPDDPAEHKPEWHQYGIITHTRRFVAALRDDVPAALIAVDPAIAARVGRYLDAPIGDVAADGVARGDVAPGDMALGELTRRDLLFVAGYWHDIGKFTTRTLGRRGDWRFIGHAHDSARLITGERDDFADGLGAQYGLDRAQIAYVARLADLHYAPMELKLALDRAGGDRTGADRYAQIAAQLGAEGYAVCCLFWADCVAKGETPRQLAERPQLWDLFGRTLRAVDASR